VTTTVTHEGSKKEWTGPIENWDAHSDVIKHACDGGAYEILMLDTGIWYEWEHNVISEFNRTRDFRIKQREPKPGEVYYCEETHEALLISSNMEFVGLADGRHFSRIYDGATYAAPSVKAYYALKFLNDPSEDALYRVVQRAA
jgi:hypothetical protein